MNTDFRVSVEFFAHHKTKKLKKRLGSDGVIALLQLWSYAARLRSDGDLSGMSTEEIELAVDWNGEDGLLVATLKEVGFLDEVDGTFSLHNWTENNSWVAGVETRSDASRLSRMAKVFPDEYQTLVDAGIKGISKKDYESLKVVNDRSAVVRKIVNDRLTTVNEMPSPAPAPAPVPAPMAYSTTPDGVVVGESTPTGQQCEEQAVDGHGVPSCPHKRIVALYHEFLPELPGVKVWEGARQQNLQARWRERWKAGKYRTQDEGIAYWGKLFRHVSENCDWLMGRVQGRKGDKPFRASLDWIVNASNFAKLIEGRYDNREVA